MIKLYDSQPNRDNFFYHFFTLICLILVVGIAKKRLEQTFMTKKRNEELKKSFAATLLKWDRYQNKRQMPWKGEKDPYRIWISEIILQQTRVEQGLDYYKRFIKAFPTVQDLAKAPEAKVFKLWEGLGYYSRCRNLLASAKYIFRDLKGQFPDSYEDIKALKGVGPYTAAAIASFAYNLPYAVVDGNVFRVLARVFGIRIPIDSKQGNKSFTAIANELLDKKKPGKYNQAIMDFGATVCKPVAPLCSKCVFNKGCFANLNSQVAALPIKNKKLSIKKRWFYYLVVKYEEQLAIHKRTDKDIWQGLYEFLLIEATKETIESTILEQAIEKKWISRNRFDLVKVSKMFRQQLSHQQISGRFITVHIKHQKKMADGIIWVKKSRLRNYPFPKFINEFINLTEM